MSGQVLDFEARQIGGRVFRIEDLAVEEGFLATRGGGGDLRRGDAQRFRRLAPEVFAIDLLNQRRVSSFGSSLPQRMFSVRNHESWLWNG